MCPHREGWSSCQDGVDPAAMVHIPPNKMAYDKATVSCGAARPRSFCRQNTAANLLSKADSFACVHTR